MNEVMVLINTLKYYIFLSYRRKKIDEDLKRAKKYFKGRVLDVGGGRKTGEFKRPKVKEWITVDINPLFKLDVVADVAKLPFPEKTFNTVKATELFEHVVRPRQGLDECLRVLKIDGFLILSMPFLYPIHNDPLDFQRFSEAWFREFFEKRKVKIVQFKKQGLYFTVLGDFLRSWILLWPRILRYIAYLIVFPFLDFLVWMEKFELIKESKFFQKYVAGYFLIVQKKS